MYLIDVEECMSQESRPVVSAEARRKLGDVAKRVTGLDPDGIPFNTLLMAVIESHEQFDKMDYQYRGR